MKILVLNAGSSSLKFNLIECTAETIANNTEKTIAAGEAERVSNMTDALGSVFDKIGNARVDAVGHRIVHGGDRFHESVVIDAGVEKEIDALSALAPLHNPHNLEGYRAAKKRLPSIPHVAVFDTAFHHTLPPRAYVYGLPYEYMTGKKIRRYGFHGISHQYVSWKYAQIQARELSDLRLITCHLGNGCSMCAIENGRSIDTSMGFTPLEGLLMGTRSGDIDAGAVLHLLTHDHLEPSDLLRTLNNDGGIKGISGVSNDMRDVLGAADAGNERAALAVDAFCYRVRKYIGEYMAAMNGVDALIFTGGIGENSHRVRARVCEGLGNLGIVLDPQANESAEKQDREIGHGPVKVWVVLTNEELVIARDTLRCVLKIPHE